MELMKAGYAFSIWRASSSYLNCVLIVKLLEIKERRLVSKFSTIQFQLASTLFNLRENTAKLNLHVRPPPTSDKLSKIPTFSQ